MARKPFSRWPLFAAAGLAVALTLAWRNTDIARASASLPDQRAAARREGVPIEWDDLRRLAPPVAEADNAAPFYARAFATFRSVGNLKGVKADDLIAEIVNGTAKPADVAHLRAELAKVAPALAEAREGSLKPGFSFDRRWELGSALTFPEYSDGRGLCRALVLRAMLAKDPASAADDLETAARMRAHLGSEPVLIAALVGNGIENDVHRGIRAVARRGGAWTAAVRPALEALGPIPSLRRTLAAEPAFGAHFAEELQRLGPNNFASVDNEPTPLAFRFVRFRPVRDAYQARVLEYWRNAWRKLPQDPTDARGARDALQMPSPESGPSYAMLEFVLPVFDRFAETNERSEADRRLTRAALDLWSGRTPTLAKDPFGGGPLRLKRTGADWTLYSVGPNGVDDGGRMRAKSSDVRYDIVVNSKGTVSERR